jgi:hypothetical protein
MISWMTMKQINPFQNSLIFFSMTSKTKNAPKHVNGDTILHITIGSTYTGSPCDIVIHDPCFIYVVFCQIHNNNKTKI